MFGNTDGIPNFEEFMKNMENGEGSIEDMLIQMLFPECRICKFIKIFTAKVLDKKVEDHTPEDLDTLYDLLTDTSVSNVPFKTKFMEAVTEVLGSEAPSSFQTTFEKFILQSNHAMIKDQKEIDLIKAYFTLIEHLRK